MDNFLDLNGLKRKRTAIPIATKLEIISKLDSGVTYKKLALEYGIGQSTIYDILKNANKILEYASALGRSKLVSHNNVYIKRPKCTWLVRTSHKGETVPVVSSSSTQSQGKIKELKYLTSPHYFKSPAHKGVENDISFEKTPFQSRNRSNKERTETMNTIRSLMTSSVLGFSPSTQESASLVSLPSSTVIPKRDPFVETQVPDLNERLGMEGSSSSGKIEGASSSFLTCSPLISSMPGIHEDVLSSGAGPSSSIQNSNENDGDYDEDMIDVKTEPVFNVESEICEEENSQSNTQSSSDRRSHQSSPTPSMIGPYLLKKETHCTTILDQLLRDDTFSDVTLTAEGQSIRAHKIVLCLASAYFRQVLSKESNVQNVIVFRDVKFSELKNLINFIYTGEATVDAADLESFMKTAEMLEVTSLCDGQRNFPKNLLPKTKESESEKVPSSTPSKTFPATKRSHAFTSAASNGSPPTKSRKTDAKDTSKKSSLVLPHPSTSGGGGGTSCPNDSIIEPTTTIIKTEPVSEDSVAEEDYELKVGTDVSFESLTRSPPPPPLAAQNQVSTDLGENQSSLPDQSACSSMSLEKVPVGKCPLCPSSQPIRKGSELTKHLYAHHPDKTVFCCESCSRVFLKKGSFEAHKNDCNR